MSIEILPSAIKDLYEGRLFYERQGDELGEYFFDSLFSDIDSLVFFAGVHEKHYGYYHYSQSISPILSTINLMTP